MVTFYKFIYELIYRVYTCPDLGFTELQTTLEVLLHSNWGLHITLKMTLHLLVKVLEALGSGQTSFFFWQSPIKNKSEGNEQMF